MRIDGEHLDPLFADLESALRELVAPTDSDPSLWDKSEAGKWTAGQHVDHIVTTLDFTSAAFGEAESRLRAGALPPVPHRRLLQRLWVSFVSRGWFPRGGKTTPNSYPRGHPERGEVIERMGRAVSRHREIGARLTAPERDRLWIPNLFRPTWHYTLPEMIRVHAVHARHHARLIEEIGRAQGTAS